MKRRRIAAICLVAAVTLTACGQSTGATPTPAAKSAASAVTPAAVGTATPQPTATLAGTTYTIKVGDTLSAVAAANNTSVDAIVRTNRLTDPDKLEVGQRLTLPPASAVPPASGSSTPSGAPTPPAAAPSRPPAP